ncbi:MAG: peptidoglycan DD-metalloendopeptidase family protein [Lachnospiraceae bacterium]|nr:peptidoglycan DD-metalloendopeptidase family protein [Lachnospiraceae bacterium]
MKRKRRIYLVILSVLAAGIMAVSPLKVRADEDDKDSSVFFTNDKIREDEKGVDDAKRAKEALAAGSAQAEKVIAALESAKGDTEEYIEKIDAEITDIEKKIEVLSGNIAEKLSEIEETGRELEDAKRRAEEQYEFMKMRVRVSYESRSETLAEAILTSRSFGELLNRAEYLEDIARYDKKKLDEFGAAIEEVKTIEKRLKAEEEALEEEKLKAESEAEASRQLMERKENEVAAYTASIGDKQAQIREYQQMIEEQNAIIASLEAAIKAERARLAEEARKYGGGTFAHPCPNYTRISDEFGMRMHPTLGVEMMHNGVDFAAPTGTPIYAAADGNVIAAGYSASMGNYVMIDHGSNIITVYMHASSIDVSEGQSVSRGDKIGAVGSTGRSTGPHLHFGVREDGSYVNPWKYLK